MTKKPTTVSELEVLIYGLIESYEQNIGHIDTDKCLGIRVFEQSDVMVMNFDFICENIPQPSGDPTKNDYEPKSDSFCKIWSKSESLYSLVKIIEETIREIDEFKIVTQEQERDWDNE